MDEQHFTVTAGSVRGDQETDLCRSLFEFAAASDCKCVLVSALLNDVVHCYATEAGARSPIARDWNRGEEHPTAMMQLWSAPVHNEVVRGVIILKGREQWPILWNRSAAGAFVSYLGVETANAEFYFGRDGELDARQTKGVSPESVRVELQKPPIVGSSWIESKLSISVPSTNEDMTHARRCLRLLEQHGTGVVIEEQQIAR